MKTYKKIDLFFNGDYLCSTNQAKTCKAAKIAWLERAAFWIETVPTLVERRVLKYPQYLTARFDHSRR
jgi:hypothetical protein